MEGPPKGEEPERKRARTSDEEEGEGDAAATQTGGSQKAPVAMGLPYELTLRIFDESLALERRNNVSARDRLRQLCRLRLVDHEWYELATDRMADVAIECIDNLIKELGAKVSSGYGEDVSESKAKQLEENFSKVSKLAEELQLVKSTIDTKRHTRDAIFKMSNLLPQQRLTLLGACALTSDLMALRAVSDRAKQSRKEIVGEREESERERDHYYDPLFAGGPPGPYGRGGGGVGPFGPYPPGPGGGGMFGEPAPDHLRPPGWNDDFERDRDPFYYGGGASGIGPFPPSGRGGIGPYPPGGRGRGTDPTSPFHDPLAGGGGMGGGGFNPLNPRGGRPPFGGPRFL